MVISEPAGGSRRRGWHRAAAFTGLATWGWLGVVAVSYWNLPLVNGLPLLGWVVAWAGTWLWAAGASLATVVFLLRSRTYLPAILGAVAAIGAGVSIVTVDWFTVYLNHQFTEHRSELSDLADAHTAGSVSDDTLLPAGIRHLSVDGRVHLQQARSALSTAEALYLPLWENWRGEDGSGLAHFRGTPEPDYLIGTAPGDAGHPTRHVGSGWWLVE